MCKFCDSLKEKSLVSYNNRKNMDIYCGQYQGVNVYGTVYMKGNMLSIGCSGSYRSRFDCYYEDEGLECDNENAHTSNNSYIHIQYCPFCGRKLEDHTYEKQKTNDDLKKLKEKLKWLEQDLRDYSLVVVCDWFCNKRILHNVEIWPGKLGDRTEYDYIEYKNDSPLTFNQISEKFPKVSLKVYYGRPQKDWNKYIRAKLPLFTFNTKIKSNGYYSGEYSSCDYVLTDEMYFKLVELGYIKHNKEKYDDLKKEQEIITKDIINVKKNIKKLEHYLKTLK